jgi:hypothetical protein
MNGYGNTLTEYSPQMETFEFSQGEDEFTGESGGGVFNESQEMELAAELLEVTNEQELDHFLGDLIKKAGSAVGQFVSSPVGQAIGGVLKTAAKTALPIAGGALGAYVGGPLGARIGSGLASMAGQALGLELEGLSQEDREFQSARQFVRWAGDTAKNTLASTQGELSSAASLGQGISALAKAAAAQAAQLHAPGLAPRFLPGVSGAQTAAAATTRSHSGRWIRRGNHLVVLGV